MRGMRVRQDAIVSSTECRDFWGQNVEAAPLPIHAQFVAVTSNALSGRLLHSRHRLSHRLPVSPFFRAVHG